MKVIWKLAILGTATLAVVAANSIREPVPYPFLEQYEVLDSRVTRPYRILTLRAEATDVLREGEKHVPPHSLWDETGDMYDCHFGRDFSNPLAVADDLNRFDRVEQKRRAPGTCVVQFRRQKSFVEEAWLWLQSKAGATPNSEF